MAINVKGLFETLQYKANNIDSSTSTAEILDTLKAIKLADGNTIISYDSDGAFPNASTTNVKLGYNKQTGKIKFNNGTWDTLTGSLDGTLFSAPGYQGSISGYHTGGRNTSNELNVIEKYSLTSDGNSTDVGDLTVLSSYGSGNSSTVSGYHTGGEDQPSPPYNIIQKFPFATDGNATDVGDMSQGLTRMFGVNATSSGYQIGGRTTATNPSNVASVEKIDFATDGNSTTLSDIITARSDGAGITDGNRQVGYIAGGAYVGAFTDTIVKFTFSNETASSSVGSLTGGAREQFAGYQSVSHGYASGGTPPTIDTIEKFPFAAPGSTSDVGNLTLGRRGHATSSSTTHGYSSGAFANPPPYTNSIDKFPFATDADATDVGDISSFKAFASGQQV